MLLSVFAMPFAIRNAGAEPTGLPQVYIDSAEIANVTPRPLVPGGPMMVTLTLVTVRPTTPAALGSNLRVFIDSVEAVPQSSEHAAAPASAATAMPSRAAGASAEERFKQGVTLFARAPYPRSTSRTAALSIYSNLDGREIAQAKVEYEEESWLDLLRRSPETLPLKAVLAMVAAAAGLWVGIVTWYVSRRRGLTGAEERIKALEAAIQIERRRLGELAGSQPDSSAPLPADATGSPPTLPDEVLQALARRELVVVLGAGASAQAGLPTGRSLWLNVLDLHKERVPSEMFERVRSLVARGASETAAELVVSLLERDIVLQALQKELLVANANSRFHELLAELQLPATVDMTWDDVMSRALSAAHPREFSPSRGEGLAEVLREARPALIKPRGGLRQPDGVSLTQREYRLALSQAPEFERSLAALFSGRTLLFFGFSLEGLEQFLATLPPQLEGAGRRHFAVWPADPATADLWEAGLGRRFGVRLLQFQPSADFRELAHTAAELVAHFKSSIVDLRGSGLPPRSSALRLEYLQLESIGQFSKLRVEFETGWTLLLGKNGGGKSTILRAITLALAGNDSRASAMATRLLRTVASRGAVELGLGGSRVLSTLVRDGTKVVLNSPQTTAVQAGQVLVLAFPALRGVSVTQVRGPTRAPAANPSVDDIAPLLQGAVDSRLDDLQQWVVNTALRAEADPGGRDERMLNTFQALVTDMVPGEDLTYSHVDRESWQVMFKSGTDVVALDSLSQGMSSILNWIGILLQRLYDVHQRADKPEEEAAIVIIDEIDAHLHPEWQRLLVGLTRSHFPNVQVIASSHSPLLAGAVEQAELRVVARSASGDIAAERPRADLAGQKAEDILVSELFSLSSTRNVEAEKTIREYFSLFHKLSLDEDERARLDELSTELQALNFGPTRHERSALEQADAEAEQAVAQTSSESVRVLQKRLRALADKADDAGSKA